MQCGMFLLLLILCRVVRNFWRQHVFGIALGFGMFASIELILVSIVIHFGHRPFAAISLIKSAAYNAVTLLWIVYLRRSSESILVLDVAPQISELNLAPVGATQAGESAFLSMVEEAVDRVLSRESWPRSSVRGSKIIGREPNREEHN
jgi:hypothetical protein